MRDVGIMIGIAFGGALGAVIRYAISIWLNQHAHTFPWGTLAVNLAGCFLLGCLMYAVEYGSVSMSPTLRIAMSSGFLGALTTFSAFGHETVERFSRGLWAMGLVNIAAHLLLGLLAVGLGRFVAEWIFVTGRLVD